MLNETTPNNKDNKKNPGLQSDSAVKVEADIELLKKNEKMKRNRK